MRRVCEPARSRLPHGHRPHARRERRRRARVQRRRHPPARQPAFGEGSAWPCSARQPRARRRGHQAGGRRASGCCSTSRPGGRVRRLSTTMAKRGRRPGAATSPPTTCWCCANAGPQGGPGMPEWGMLPMPEEAAEATACATCCAISDARMSGTSYGACVLHVAPEAFVGGPLALVRTGDIIALDVAAPPPASRRRRRRTRPPPRRLDAAPPPQFERGFGAIFARPRDASERRLRLRRTRPRPATTGAGDSLI